MLRKHAYITHIHCVKVDSDEGGRQSKTGTNSECHAISQTAYGRLKAWLNYAVYLTILHYELKQTKYSVYLPVFAVPNQIQILPFCFLGVFLGRNIQLEKQVLTDFGLTQIGERHPTHLGLIQCTGNITENGLRNLFRSCADNLKVSRGVTFHQKWVLNSVSVYHYKGCFKRIDKCLYTNVHGTSLNWTTVMTVTGWGPICVFILVIF